MRMLLNFAKTARAEQGADSHNGERTSLMVKNACGIDMTADVRNRTKRPAVLHGPSVSTFQHVHNRATGTAVITYNITR